MPESTTTAATMAAAEAQRTARPDAKRQRRTPEQQIARLREQLARATAQQSKRSRQLDTREKIVIGGAVLKAMRHDHAFRSQITTLLQNDVTRDLDREAIASWLSDTSAQR